MSLIINIKSNKDEKFVIELLAKLGFMSKHVDIDEMEDIAFANVMNENDHRDVLTLEEARERYVKMKKRK